MSSLFEVLESWESKRDRKNSLTLFVATLPCFCDNLLLEEPFLFRYNVFQAR